MKTLKFSWLIYAISGLLLLGAGLSMCIDAAFYRMVNSGGWEWIAYGTFALMVFNSGVCLFGQAIIFKVRLGNK